jgi:hypothetical protein
MNKMEELKLEIEELEQRIAPGVVGNPPQFPRLTLECRV